MLLELHVKNLALIERADLEFDTGFSVLTGETGAGKSILIDSINIALGAKFSKDMIRTGADTAMVELVFQIEDAKILSYFKEEDIPLEEDGILIISRKVNAQRSTIKVNDESITISKLKKLTSMLIDIHGQNEHHFLMNNQKQLEVLDLFGASSISPKKEAVANVYREYKPLLAAMKEELDASLRAREMEILEYEIGEIRDAKILPDEEEELLTEFRKMKNFAKINSSLSEAVKLLEASEISKASRIVKDVLGFDMALSDLSTQLEEIDVLLSDAMHLAEEYIGDAEFDEERFFQIENRLDVIHKITNRYGSSYEEVMRYLEEKTERLSFLEHFDERRAKDEKRLAQLEEELKHASMELRDERKRVAKDLILEILAELKGLNFLNLEFDIAFTKQPFSSNGADGIEFEISTNPGEPLKPMKDVLSGGELSRVMLAIKTVLAKVDDIPTLIFDEIDTGISGRTAQMVSNKLESIGRTKQVLCISHLPQIAAMADHHYLIAKSSDGKSTRTDIQKLDEVGMVEELARLLGGSEITQAVLETAREMKKLADAKKM